MVLGNTHGLTLENISVSGKMANNMVMENSQWKMVFTKLAIGTMAKEQNG